MKGSNTRTSREEKAREDGRQDGAEVRGHPPKAQTSLPKGSARPRGTRDQDAPPKTQGPAPPPPARQAQPSPAPTKGVAYGPERIQDLRRASDDLVVGERTVVHHAARYGIVRGMTWTVILSALLFWLPVMGPAIAGYVGGRKAGGPIRGIVAVAIPAVVMLVALAALSEGLSVVPAGVTSTGGVDVDNLAGLPASSVPLLGGIQRSIVAWVAAPPDVFFIMAAFAIVGGVLSAQRRREEETIIEKVGIPLGELKERLRKEEGGTGAPADGGAEKGLDKHPLVAGPLAAHDAVNEMVEEIVERVIDSLERGGMVPTARGRSARGRATARALEREGISTGMGGPAYDMLEPVGARGMAATRPAATRRGPRTAGGRSRSRARTAAAGAVPAEDEDWEVVDTDEGRRPIRVVHSPTPAKGKKVAGRAMVSEPEMHVESRVKPFTRKREDHVVYGSAPPARGLRRFLSRPSIEERSSTPYQGLGWEEEVAMAIPDETPQAPAPPAPVGLERLPIVSSILEASEADDTLRYSGSVKAIDGPSLTDTIDAEAIAESAAQELTELARVEEGPEIVATGELRGQGTDIAKEAEPVTPVDVVPEEVPDEVAVEEPAPTKRKKRKSPKSTSRMVKHPAGALKSKGRTKSEETTGGMIYEENIVVPGTAEWSADREIEEEDLFNPRRLEDDKDDDVGSEDRADDEDWAEQERIGALVREREEWDRL